MKYTYTTQDEFTSIAEVTISADKLTEAEDKAVDLLKDTVKADGFRKGKVPKDIAKKKINPMELASESSNIALQDAVVSIIKEKDLRLLERPEIEVKKFVPNDMLEAVITFQLFPDVQLMDFSKVKVKEEKIEISDDEVSKVLDNLRLQSAEKVEVDRAAKDDDEVWIDFKGVDKDGKDVAGAAGNDYPLRLGSDSFIPGFEDALIGVKAGEERTFDVTFPKDYHHGPLQNKKVVFTASAKKVKEVQMAKLDDEFAKGLGPFKDLDSLKSDVKHQLIDQKQNEAMAKMKDQALEQVIEGSKLPVPQSLLDDQLERTMQDFTQNLAYRGITLAEYAKDKDMTEEQVIKEEFMPKAEKSVQVGLVMAEITRKEQLTVSDEEIDRQLARLKAQNPSMAEQMDDEDTRRDVANRLLADKAFSSILKTA